MTRYIKPEVCLSEALTRLMICDSVVGGSTDDFTESQDIDWTW